MREIKFRAWDKRCKEMMSQNDLEHFDFWTEIVQVNNMPSQGKDYVLMQFTGLLDKNGKEIYEGDILKRPKLSYGKKMGNVYKVVKWVNSKRDNGFNIASSNEKYEVIGNIYSNPELIK